MLWESPTQVQIVGLLGKFPLRLQLELLDWMHMSGIETLRIQRYSGHRIPGAKLMPDGYMHIDVAGLAARRAATRAA